MVIEYRLGENDPEVEVNREENPVRVIFDPRLTILQIRRSLIEILTPSELTRFINATTTPLEYSIGLSLLSLVS